LHGGEGEAYVNCDARHDQVLATRPLDRSYEFSIFSEAEDARAELAERHGELAGSLRISAPVSFGTLHLGRAIFPFLQANPRIQLTLDLDDRFVDVVGDGYDAVVRHARIPDARVVVKKLGASRRYLVASPEYLRVPKYAKFPVRTFTAPTETLI
jgi:DNA-binding transcriptional LysR family regulator